MKKSVVARSLAAATCGLLAVTTAGAASGSDYNHPAVVSADAVDWTPNLVVESGKPKPVAYSIAEAGSQMVVGGRFSAVETGKRTGQVARSNVFAFDATNGDISGGFAPTVDGDVWSVVSDGTSVYLGGAFKTVNGTSRPALAKVSLATGTLDTAFNPGFTGGRVTDMELHKGQLFVAGTFRSKLAALSPTTGRPTSYTIPAVTGRLANSDSAQVFKFDISTTPSGDRLVAVGNFTDVAGQPRPRAFMLNVGATSATLSDWNYEPLGINCTSTRRNAIAYMQDVDFAPGGSWFSFAAFGYMYQSGQRGFQLCDSVSRFDTADLNPAKPVWINYTGGDSLKSVGVTDKGVYVQGHSRWLDNPFGQDFAGPGAVDRLGGGAVDPVTGLALSWNPVMPQQSGGYQILPTAAGVWFATDGSRFGGEYHRGIRFAPLP